MKVDIKTFKVQDAGRLGTVSFVVGVVLLAISGVGYFTDPKQFFHSYLTAFMYWLSIALGGLFFTMLHHLTGARWSIVLRRLAESVASSLPVMFLLFIPIALGLHDLFHWTHADAVATDELLQSKAPYLNTGFFYIRAAIYFLVWIALSRSLVKTSLQQDIRHDESQIIRLRKISAPGMLLFAATISFASFDWIMSLDPHWYSTIFGVYVFSGAFLAILSFMILMSLYQRRNNVLADVVTVEHYHDLGKFSFAFIIFWAYMAFSQYFIIWYGNIPEETYWYLYRWDNSWRIVSLIIIFGHFVIPFVGLITRASKRHLGYLGAMAAWILVMRWVDLYWLVMPTYHRDGMSISYMDFTCWLGMGGLFVWWVWRRYTAAALVPVNDPGLEASIKFTNA